MKPTIRGVRAGLCCLFYSGEVVPGSLRVAIRAGPLHSARGRNRVSGAILRCAVVSGFIPLPLRLSVFLDRVMALVQGVPEQMSVRRLSDGHRHNLTIPKQLHPLLEVVERCDSVVAVLVVGNWADVLAGLGDFADAGQAPDSPSNSNIGCQPVHPTTVYTKIGAGSWQ